MRDYKRLVTRAVKVHSILWSFPRAGTWCRETVAKLLVPSFEKINRIGGKVDGRGSERKERKERQEKEEETSKEGGRLALICSPPQILAAKHRARAAQRSLENKQTIASLLWKQSARTRDYLMQPACPVVTL